jgi:alkanesulfonate monooxygenase SsuD/methylene tetrahydromethanopterin reductase-like flavin-dependent oxidoreductase (luciferase family)
MIVGRLQRHRPPRTTRGSPSWRWPPPPTRRQFDAARGRDGAFFIGDPETVAAKCLRVSDQLGGIERINLQMTNPRLRHADLLHSIELLGTGVVPLVKN